MAAEGLAEASKLLQQDEQGDKALLKAITMVEDFPYYKSVGYGGLPNEIGIVELDAAFMNGSTMAVGAVAAVCDIANPVLVAHRLSNNAVNSFLVGDGAEEYAVKQGFERKTMLTGRAIQHYNKRLNQIKQSELRAYDGHDTVAAISLDSSKSMYAATSTSGLFMKKRGRLGDSALCGSGFYVDSNVGGAGATGLGEDLMKGVISYEIVRLMAEGLSPQQACDKAVFDLEAKLKSRQGQSGDISVVAINNKGDFGAASTINTFSFVVASKNKPLTIYLCTPNNGTTSHRVADAEWLAAYEKRIREPIE
jgi:N4-(beta-N-acetylglucosaminyl)-L-asparaginase